MNNNKSGIFYLYTDCGEYYHEPSESKADKKFDLKVIEYALYERREKQLAICKQALKFYEEEHGGNTAQKALLEIERIEND